MDHGKTALVKNLTGVDTDTLAEEKARGLSINPGFAYLPFDGGVLGIVDLPGHRDFINNMLAGSAAVDGAMLVVAADDGVMPQTEEHAAILDLLGLQRGLAVITKTDRVDAARVKEVRGQVKALLADTGLAAIPIFAVSNIDGDGIEEVRRYLASLFHNNNRPPLEGGQAKQGRLSASRGRSQLSGGGTVAQISLTPFALATRYLIDRAFIIKGAGTVVTGSLRSGRISAESRLVHSASGETARVRGLRLDQQQITEAAAGSRVALNISLPHSDLQRGDWLTDESLHRPLSRLDTRLRLLQADTRLRPAAQYHLHIGAAHRLVRLRRLGEKQPYYQIALTEGEAPLFACYGDRFILRDPSSRHTLGGGMVVDCTVPRRGRAGPRRLAELVALDQPHEAALLGLLELRPGGVDLQVFAADRGLERGGLLQVIRGHTRNSDSSTRHSRESGNPERTDSGKAAAPYSAEWTLTLDSRFRGNDGGHPLRDHRLLQVQGRPFLLHGHFFEDYREKVLERLQVGHQQHPERQGLDEAALAAALKVPPPLLQALLAAFIESGAIAKSGTAYHLPGHAPRRSPEEERFLARVRPLLLKAGRVAPRTRELADATGIPLKALQRLLGQAARSGSLIRVADNRHYLPETVAELAAFTEALAAKSADGGFSVIEFRDASGLGRNLCIDILEYFDRSGLTRRAGNSRFLRSGSPPG